MDLVTEKLKEADLGFERADAYVTPRRLALVVDGLPERQLVMHKEHPRDADEGSGKIRIGSRCEEQLLALREEVVQGGSGR